MQNEPLQERDVGDFLEYCDELWRESIEKKQFAQYMFGVPLELLRIKDQRLFLLLGKIVDYKNIIKIISLCGHVLDSNSDDIQYEINKYMMDLVKFTSYREYIKELDNQQICTFLYLYERYQFSICHKESYILNDSQINITNIYHNKVTSNYGLITVDDDKVVRYALSPARIYDSGINKTIFLYTPQNLVKLFMKMYSIGLIERCAFRGNDAFIYDGENNSSVVLEEFGTGREFSLDVVGLPDFNMLYDSSKYDSQLQVKISKEDIIFEELKDNPDLLGDRVVTQVIHLEFNKLNNGKCYISHLDHEYILYTKEEYNMRKHDSKQKGNASKRIKTFKLDCCRIPFDYKCIASRHTEDIEVPFIYYVIDNYFDNKKLVNEYFAKILPQNDKV